MGGQKRDILIQNFPFSLFFHLPYRIQNRPNTPNSSNSSLLRLRIGVRFKSIFNEELGVFLKCVGSGLYASRQDMRGEGTCEMRGNGNKIPTRHMASRPEDSNFHFRFTLPPKYQTNISI